MDTFTADIFPEYFYRNTTARKQYLTRTEYYPEV